MSQMINFSQCPSAEELKIIERIENKIDAAISLINREGGGVDPNNMTAEQFELAVQYVEWLLLPIERRGTMPRSLRYGLNNLTIGGGSNVQ